MEALRASVVVKRFQATTAVDAVELSVAQGEVRGLLGPNGAGKTMLLRMLFGLVRPDAGSIELLGHPFDASSPVALEGVAGFVEEPSFTRTCREGRTSTSWSSSTMRPQPRPSTTPSSAAASPAAAATASPATRRACASGSRSPRRCSAPRACFSSTSPRADSIPRARAPSPSSSAGSVQTAWRCS